MQYCSWFLNPAEGKGSPVLLGVASRLPGSRALYKEPMRNTLGGSTCALRFANVVVNFALGGVAMALRYLVQAAQTLQ